MAILLCSKCSYLREVSNEYIGETHTCPVCKESVPIHNAVSFAKNVITKYQSLHEKYHKLKAEIDSAPVEPIQSNLDDNIDLHNTSVMADQTQFKPIIDWFDGKGISLDVNTKTVDTQGFFDEIAVALGDNYQLLREVNDRIKKTQRNGYNSVTLSIANYSQQDIRILTNYCKELYDYSLVAKYFYKKSEKRIHLILQKTGSVVNFFNGEWFEWFVFMKLLILFYEKDIAFSALRSFKVQFPNQDKYEVDVFFLINDTIPLFIECKSGEFRSTIEKYHILRKRMEIEKENFTMLVLGLSDEQAKGLTSMYDITFVNENNFIDYFLNLL